MTGGQGLRRAGENLYRGVWWKHRFVGWGAAAIGTAGVLALLSNQLFLGHRASGKSIEWAQAAAWAVPTLMAWCVALPATLALARRWPLTLPVRPSRLATHAGFGLAVGFGVLVLHLIISWILGWIPRDPAILPYELIMTGRSYGGLNLLAYWSLVAWVGTRRTSPRTAHEPTATGDDPFVARVGDRQVLVAPDAVDWIEAAGNYVRLHTADRSFLVRMTLTEAAARLAPNDFIRIHRSVIVRKAAVQEFHPRPTGDYGITLRGGPTLTLSRRYRADVLPKLKGR